MSLGSGTLGGKWYPGQRKLRGVGAWVRFLYVCWGWRLNTNRAKPVSSNKPSILAAEHMMNTTTSTYVPSCVRFASQKLEYQYFRHAEYSFSISHKISRLRTSIHKPPYTSTRRETELHLRPGREMLGDPRVFCLANRIRARSAFV